LMMSLWDALRMNMMISYQELVRTFPILFQGKTNRWLVRYYDKKNRSNIQLPIDINEITGNEIKRAGLEHDNNRIFIEHPEDVLRISGLILDSLQYVQNDENFRKRRP
ncbi:hypothetical protein LGP01_21205, partial [Escherichia coli]|nr:hypothetical protein [Escherichia coli]